MNPGNTDDTYLMNNDYIVVTPVGKVVEIAGEVKRPFRYELKEGENLMDLLEYSGGLKELPIQEQLPLKRYAENENQVIDINLDSLRLQGKRL